MPDGRFLSRRISQNEQLGKVSTRAALFFTWCIPHLDRDGRMTGNPELLKSNVCPLQKDISAPLIPDLICELSPLVRWYEVGGKCVLEFPGFHGEQKGKAWYDREAESRFPQWVSTALDLVQTRSEPGLDQVRLSSSTSSSTKEVQETTAPPSADANVEKPPEGPTARVVDERPAYTLGELLLLANDKLGLGRLPYRDQAANKRILNVWLFSSDEKRDPTDIACAIEGAAHMRDTDRIGWDSAKPGTPVTLKALNGPMTLADQGDGKAVRNLFDVAAEYWRKRDAQMARTPNPTARLKGAPMKGIGDILGQVPAPRRTA